MIFKQYKTTMKTLGVLLITMTPLWAENQVLIWLEGKSTQSKSDPCAAKFPGTQLFPGTSSTCYGCPKGSTPIGTDSAPSCSIAGTSLNACHNDKIEGTLGNKNVCFYCLVGKYNGVDCI